LSVVRASGKTALLCAVVVLTNVAGNFALSYGMKRADGSLPAALINPYVASGILLLIGWTVSRMSLLSRADLSFVLPVTSLGYVLNALAGRFLLGEAVSIDRWAGAVLITVGAMLASSTSPRS
jgi:uncharacterized membrane protein